MTDEERFDAAYARIAREVFNKGVGELTKDEDRTAAWAANEMVASGWNP